MNIVVTGAAGFIGSHLCEALRRRGHAVTGIDCFTNYYSRVLKEDNARAVEAAGARMVRADLALDDVGAAVRGAEIIFHLAAQPGISARVPFALYVRNNLLTTHRLLEAAQKARRLRCLVYVSTSSVYGARATDSEESAAEPISHYGVTKLAAEQLVMSAHRAGSVPACSVRLFSVYGPRERPEKLYPTLVRSIMRGEPFPLHAGSQAHLRSFTYVDDAVRGLMAVLDNLPNATGEIFNIGNDTAISTKEAIAIVERCMGQAARSVEVPPRPGDQLSTCANIQKARRILGYHPAIKPEEGLARFVRWARLHAHLF